MRSTKDIIDMIRNLQAKAMDASLSEAEAAAFANKVQELLTQHNLDHIDPHTEEDEKANVIEEEAYGGFYISPWRALLAHATATFYFCKVYSRITSKRFENDKKTIVFVGKEHNRAISISMFAYLQATVVRLSKEHSTKRGDQLAFERGCGIALSNRIHAEFEKLQRVPNMTSGIPALYKTELQLVDDFLAKMQLRNDKRKYDVNSQAARAGMDAAKTISLNNQLDARSSGVKLLG